MEKLRSSQEAGVNPEKYWIRAVCFDCGWQSELPSTLLRLVNDTELLRDVALLHEERYDHRVTMFSTKQK